MQNLTKRLAAPLALALATGGLAACSQDPGTPGVTDESGVDGTLADAIGGAAGMTTVGSALDDSGLDSVFDGPGAYTIFAPNDAAFEALGDDTKTLTGEDQRPILVAILRDHVVPGAVTPEGIKQAIKDAGGTVKMRTLGEGSISFSDGPDGLLITGPDGAKATLAGEAIAASNGVLVPIDGVLASPPATQ